MTELERDMHLMVAKEILRQAEPQLDTTEFQKLFDNMIQKASVDALMRQEYLLTAESISDIITSYQERLMGLQGVVTYIEQTPAEELNAEEIRSRIKRFAQPEGGGFTN